MSIRSFFGRDPLEMASAVVLLLVVVGLAALVFAGTVFFVGLTLGFDMSYMAIPSCPPGAK